MFHFLVNCYVIILLPAGIIHIGVKKIMERGFSTGGIISLTLGWGLVIFATVFCFLRVFSRAKKGERNAGSTTGRVLWASRTGLILAMAGNAIGLGNFLRFPVKAAANGGGVFMIPYFCALIFLGFPLMWVEWAVGRYGGVRGHGTTPGMFDLMWKHPVSKYLGVLGVALPFIVATFYTCIESWTLAFAWFSASGKYSGITSQEGMAAFLRGFQGVESNEFFPTLLPALIFLVITIALNYFFLRRGVSQGIEALAKWGIPILFVLAVILAARALTVGTPDPAYPERSAINGLAYMWNPDFSRLGSAAIWLAAAGQVFFTLGLGQGIINTYASYIREEDDVALNSLTTSTLNEFAEVILGGTITITVAVAFFGLANTIAFAREGAFNLGFLTLPVIFQKLPVGQLFGAFWFLLLFVAGITSSVAVLSPLIAFLEDEFGWNRVRAVNVTFALLSVLSALVLLFLRYGFLDELDFWAGTIGLVFFGIIEVVIFAWVFGINKGWAEIHKSADIKIIRIFKVIIKYVTPAYMLVVLGAWVYQEAIAKFLMTEVASESKPYVLGARVLMIVVVAMCIIMVRAAWKRGKNRRPAG